MKDCMFYLFVAIALSSVAFTSDKQLLTSAETATILEYINLNPLLNTTNYFYQTIKKNPFKDSIPAKYKSIRCTEEIGISLLSPVELTLPMISKTVNIYPFNLIDWQSNGDIHFSGDGISIPHHLYPGQKLPNGSFSFTSGTLTASVNITEREVTGYERIKTAIGRYDCFKLKEKHSVNILGLITSYTVESWYTQGLGLVKSVSYNTARQCMNIQQLHAIQYEKAN